MIADPLGLDPKSLGVGAVFAALITSAANLIGSWLNRNTKIDTSKIDDRGKFSTALMEQLERAFTEIGELRHSVAVIQRREGVYIRLLANLGAEMRVSSAFVETLIIESEAGRVDKVELKTTLTRLKESFTRMERLVEADSKYLQDELRLASESVLHEKKTVAEEAKKA